MSTMATALTVAGAAILFMDTSALRDKIITGFSCLGMAFSAPSWLCIYMYSSGTRHRNPLADSNPDRALPDGRAPAQQ